MKIWQWYLLAVNAASFAAFGIDKALAKAQAWRIPEKVLFMLAGAGGSPGAMLGMKLFHHKTLHKSFTLGIPAILILQVMLVAGILFWYYRGRG